MRSLLAALLLLITLAAGAASLEENYLAARDLYVAKFKPINESGKITDADFKAEEDARADLEKQLKTIVGPVAIKGMSQPAKINADTLFAGDLGFGMLDGLVLTAADEKTRVIVTTETLFASWLRAHKNWYGDKVAEMPQDAGAAFKTEAFYTQAISTDAAVVHYAQLPLAKSASAKLTFAVLAARTQDASPPAPDEIFAAMIAGGRVYVANAPLSSAFAPIPACDQIKRDYDNKAAAAFDAAAPEQKKEQNGIDAFTALREQGDAAFRRCFAERTSKQALARAAKQAQSLIARLPLR